MRDDTNTRVRVVNLESGDVDTYGLTKPALLRAREEALLNLVGFLIPTKMRCTHSNSVYFSFHTITKHLLHFVSNSPLYMTSKRRA